MYSKAKTLGWESKVTLKMLSKGLHNFSHLCKSWICTDVYCRKGFFLCPSCTWVIINILSAVKESNMSHSTYQFYLFPELKLIDVLPAFHKRVSLVSTFNFDPSRVWVCQRTWLVYLCWMLTHFRKAFPQPPLIWFLQYVNKTTNY